MNTKPGVVANLLAQTLVIPAVWQLEPWLAVFMAVVMVGEILMLVKVWRKL